MENEVKRELQVSDENITAIKDKIDWAMGDCEGAPSQIIVPMLLNVLDTAQKGGRLNAKERIIACEYITEAYGYNF